MKRNKQNRRLWVLLSALGLVVLSGCGADLPRFVVLGGTVYMDNNGNDIRDESDTPVPNVEVTFVNAEDILDGKEGAGSVSTVTDADGIYAFDFTSEAGVYPGAYLQFTVPEGMALANHNVGDDDLIDSDISTSEDHYGKALLESGTIVEIQLTIDALMVEK